MNRYFNRVVWSLCFAVGTLQASMSFAQSAKDLLGTWSFVSVNVVDGEKKFEPFGPKPKGMLVLDGKRFSIIVMRNELPKISSNNRMTATPDENRTVVQGSLAYFGTYTVDDAKKMLTLTTDASTYANWTGTDQPRTFQLSGSDLTLTNPAGSAGGVATIRLRRAD